MAEAREWYPAKWQPDKKYAPKTRRKNSISDIYHTHFSLYYKLEVLQIFSGRHRIHMKAFQVMLVHLFR